MIKIKTICVNKCAYKCVEVVHDCLFLCSVFCSLCYLVCAAYMCIFVLCAYICLQVYMCSVLFLVRMCMCVHVCAYVWGLCANQSDTPGVGILCGYMVRIIKYKKTQPLIKLKSIWFSTFLLSFKIMFLLSEKVSITWNVLPDEINLLEPKKTGKNRDFLLI